MAAQGSKHKVQTGQDTDGWTTREKLILSCSVLRSGDQNWVSVSRTIRPICESVQNRASDWFSQKNCAQKYADLLESVDTPKRKRTANEPGGTETPQEQILRRLTFERIEELKQSIKHDHEQYRELKQDIESIRSGKVDSHLKKIWEDIQSDKKVSIGQLIKETSTEASSQQNPLVSQSQSLSQRPRQQRVTKTTPKFQTYKEQLKQQQARYQHQHNPSQHHTQQQQQHQSPVLPQQHKHDSLLPKQKQSDVSPKAEAPLQLPQHQSQQHLPRLQLPDTLPKARHTEAAVKPVEIKREKTVPCLADDSIVKKETSRVLPNPIIDVNVPVSSAATVEQSTPNVTPKLDGDKKEQEKVTKRDEKSTGDTSLGQSTSLLQIDNVAMDTVQTEIKSEPTEIDRADVDMKQDIDSAIVTIPTPDTSSPDAGISIKKDAKEDAVPHATVAEESTHEEKSHDSEQEVVTVDVEDEPVGAEDEVNQPDENKAEDAQNVAAADVADDADTSQENQNDTIKDHEPKAEGTDDEEAGIVDQEEDLQKDPSDDDEESNAGANVDDSMDRSSLLLDDTRSDLDSSGVMESTDGHSVASPTPKRKSRGRQPKHGKKKTTTATKHEDIGDDSLGSVEEATSERDDAESEHASIHDPKEFTEDDSIDEDSPSTCAELDVEEKAVDRDFEHHRLQAVVTSPASPALSTGSNCDPETAQAQKTWRKSIMLVWKAAASHRYANVFLHPVTNDEAPGYRDVIYRPMDLQTIKKNIENGSIRTTSEFQRDMMLMFQNAIMYNSADHDVFRMAQEMRDDVMEQIQSYIATQLMMQSSDRESKMLRGHKTEVGAGRK